MLVFFAVLLVLLAYRLVRKEGGVEEAEARRSEEMNKDKVEEEEEGVDNLGYKVEPDSEGK